MAATTLTRATAFGLVGLALSVGIMEGVLRIIEYTPAWRALPIVERELGWPDATAGYALRQNHQIINVRENRARPTTNSFGMRDRDRHLHKPPNTYRVLLTGDSFTEALQVEDEQTFSRLAEKSLTAARSDASFEIFNLGMSGAGPVQQYVRARETVNKFSPDALVMLVNIDQFSTKEMSDDSINPAYVLDGNGALKLGYGFRARASQRYRRTWLGKIFFVLMDHSLIARATYLRVVQRGHGMLPSISASDRPKTLSCGPIAARLKRIIARWQSDKPLSVAHLSTQLFSDIADLSKTVRVKTAIVFYGIGEPSLQCEQAISLREGLVAQLSESLARYEIEFWDADWAIVRARHGPSAEVPLHGFGRQQGVGHLNLAGHRYYAGLLVDIVMDLGASRIRNTGEP
jgi:hypothetical protein